MVKDKSDKTKLKNWEEGDTFALKIDSKEFPEYNNRYIIFIHCIVDKESWKLGRTTKLFRAKITKDKKIPRTKEEIEELEYIKTSESGYLFEHYFYPEETKNLQPDEYMLVYQYISKINAFKYKIPKGLIYIGNFNIEKPLNEYIPKSPFNCVALSFWEYPWDYKYDATDDMVQYYTWYNLKTTIVFTKEFQKSFIKDEQKRIEAKIKDDIHVKTLIELEKKGLLKIDEKKRTNNSITYVGGKDTDQSKTKKQK